MIKRFSVVSLFSGAGGMDLGFEVAGFHTECFVEIDPYSCNTLRNNISSFSKRMFKGSRIIEADIRKVSAKDLFKGMAQPNGKVDLLIGGPPCQAFSVFGKRQGLKDPRGTLVWEYIRILKDLKPEGFVFENVSGLKTIAGGELFSKLEDELSCGGRYKVTNHTYEVASYGIPQFRKRVFFIGSRHTKTPLMTPTHGNGDNTFLKPHITVRKVLSSMPRLASSGLPNHVGRAHGTGIIERYRSLAYGERDHKTRINKLHPDRPSFTIIVGSDKGGGKGHVHPYEPREVTPRESARMQTFPDDWAFTGTSRHPIRQVGNAVPPLFAGLLASHLLRHMFGKKRVLGYEELCRKLKLSYLL